MAIVTNCEFRSNPAMSRAQKDIAERLQALEDAVAESGADLCREAKIAPNAWSQFKNPEKKRRITVNAAFKLKDRYGATLEWIYDGEIHTLPPELAKAINKAGNVVDTIDGWPASVRNIQPGSAFAFDFGPLMTYRKGMANFAVEVIDARTWR